MLTRSKKAALDKKQPKQPFELSMHNICRNVSSAERKVNWDRLQLCEACQRQCKETGKLPKASELTGYIENLGYDPWWHCLHNVWSCQGCNRYELYRGWQCDDCDARLCEACETCPCAPSSSSDEDEEDSSSDKEEED